jgi:hypothetical protein
LQDAACDVAAVTGLSILVWRVLTRSFGWLRLII